MSLSILVQNKVRWSYAQAEQPEAEQLLQQCVGTIEKYAVADFLTVEAVQNLILDVSDNSIEVLRETVAEAHDDLHGFINSLHSRPKLPLDFFKMRKAAELNSQRHKDADPDLRTRNLFAEK